MRNKECQKCPLHVVAKTVCLWGVGPTPCDIMFVGRDPGEQEDIKGLPFVGPAGQILNNLLISGKMKREEVYITNLVKCHTSNNRGPSDSEVAQCREYLEEEIALVKPKIIVPLGGDALKALTGKDEIMKMAGKPIISEKYGCTIFPTYHPSFLLRQGTMKPRAEQQFEAIGRLLRGEVLESKPVKYIIIDDFARVDNMLNKVQEQTEVAVDLETTGLDFLQDKILCFSFSWKEHTGVVLPLLGQHEAKIWTDEQYNHIIDKLKETFSKPSISWIGHNISFDHKFLKRYGIEIAGDIHDTMILQTLIDENASDLKGLKSLAILYTDMGEYDKPLTEMREVLKTEERKKFNDRKKQLKEKVESLAEQLESIPIDSGERDLLYSEFLASEALLEEMIEEGAPDISYALFPTDVLWPYAAADTDATLRIFHILTQKLRTESDRYCLPHNKSLVKLYSRLVMPLRKVLDQMECTGTKLDLPYLQALGTKYIQQMNVLDQEIVLMPCIKKVEDILYTRAKVKVLERYNNLKKKMLSVEEYAVKHTPRKKFNPNSAIQLGILLYEVLKLPVVKMGKPKKDGSTSPSTDKEVLELMVDKDPVIKKLHENRVLQKLHKTYVIGMQKRVDDNGRIHTSYNQHVAVTGRLSSSNPNLQNIPRENKDIKCAFIADDGWSLLQLDLAQAEFRMWAELSQDPDMIRDIRNGLDIHRATAAQFWNIRPEDVTKKQRTAAKFVVFGLMYGRGAASVAKQVGIQQPDAEAIITQFFGKYPTAARWLEQTKYFARTHGYVISKFGRVRRLPMALAGDKKEKAEADRQAVNSPIQGGAADVTGVALIRLWKYLKESSYKSQIVLTVHDSIVLHCPDDELLDMSKLGVKALTEPVAGMGVPFEAEIEVGKNWGSLKTWDLKSLQEEYNKYLGV